MFKHKIWGEKNWFCVWVNTVIVLFGNKMCTATLKRRLEDLWVGCQTTEARNGKWLTHLFHCFMMFVINMFQIKFISCIILWFYYFFILRSHGFEVRLFGINAIICFFFFSVCLTVCFFGHKLKMMFPSIKKCRGFCGKKLWILYARIYMSGRTEWWSCDSYSKISVQWQDWQVKRKVITLKCPWDVTAEVLQHEMLTFSGPVIIHKMNSQLMEPLCKIIHLLCEILNILK